MYETTSLIPTPVDSFAIEVRIRAWPESKCSHLRWVVLKIVVPVLLFGLFIANIVLAESISPYFWCGALVVAGLGISYVCVCIEYNPITGEMEYY
jgi:hypothetical protein